LPDALSVAVLSVVRGGRAVVDRVTFAARFGCVTGLLGPNGAGKSSIVKALAGILPYEGDIAIEGCSARELDGPERARRVAYVPQQSELRSALSVASLVEQGRYAHHAGRLRSTAHDRAAVARALELTETASLAERSFLTLSQGERQRVLLARALATEARILLLDEPTSALDVGHALKAYAMLRRLAQQGYSVLAVLHPLNEALEWTDEAVLIDRGRLLASGPTRTIISQNIVGATYGIELVPSGALGFRLPGALP
jgi:iron complex transport system ATP-binding protein